MVFMGIPFDALYSLNDIQIKYDLSSDVIETPT
jgi:hypothetical protein